MNKLILTFSIVLFALSGFGQFTKVAMLETIQGSDGVSDMILNMVRGELTKSIAAEPDYSAFARTDIDKMMKELDFQQSGMVDDDQLAELGIMSGADFVCLSKISKDGQTYYIEASLINIETGKIENPSTAFVNGGGMTTVNSACRGVALDLMGKKNNSNGVYGSSSNNYKSENKPEERTSADKPAFPIAYKNNDVLFNINSCKIEGNTITMDGILKNTGDIQMCIFLNKKSAAVGECYSIYTDAGNKIEIKNIYFGDKHCSMYSEHVWQDVPSGVVLRFSYTFEDVPANISYIQAFTFKTGYELKGKRAVFKEHTLKNIPVEH